MKIAIGFFGKYRFFDKVYKNVFETFKSKNVQLDSFISTWAEEKFDVEKKIDTLRLENLIKTEIDEENDLINNKIKIFSNLYPMMLKKIKVLNLIKNNKKNYNFVILCRMDTLFKGKMNYNILKKKTLYSGKGFRKISDGNIIDAWKDKMYVYDEYSEIFKFDKSLDTNYSNQLKGKTINPVCDQIYIADIETLERYLKKIIDILELYYEKRDNVSKINKFIEKFLYIIFCKFYERKYIFKIYKTLSKKIGFYTPFWINKNLDTFAKYKPTLFAYSVNFQNIFNEVLNIDYFFIREKDKIEYDFNKP